MLFGRKEKINHSLKVNFKAIFDTFSFIPSLNLDFSSIGEKNFQEFEFQFLSTKLFNLSWFTFLLLSFSSFYFFLSACLSLSLTFCNIVVNYSVEGKRRRKNWTEWYFSLSLFPFLESHPFWKKISPFLSILLRSSKECSLCYIHTGVRIQYVSVCLFHLNDCSDSRRFSSCCLYRGKGSLSLSFILKRIVPHFFLPVLSHSFNVFILLFRYSFFFPIRFSSGTFKSSWKNDTF